MTTTRTAPDTWLTAGPVVLGAAASAAAGYAIAVWFARMATYAERVEEEQYCGPEHAVGVPAQARPVPEGLLPAVPG